MQAEANLHKPHVTANMMCLSLSSDNATVRPLMECFDPGYMCVSSALCCQEEGLTQYIVERFNNLSEPDQSTAGRQCHCSQHCLQQVRHGAAGQCGGGHADFFPGLSSIAMCSRPSGPCTMHASGWISLCPRPDHEGGFRGRGWQVQPASQA